MEQIQIVNALGQPVEVVDGAVLARARTEFDLAVLAGRAFSWANATYDYAALDTVLAVQNDSATLDLCIQRLLLTGDTATEFVAHTSPGVVLAGTAVAAVNLNRGSALGAPARAVANETGNTQNADGYTGRVVTGRFAANGQAEVSLDGALVLPAGWTFGVDLITNGAAVNAVIWGYFKARA